MLPKNGSGSRRVRVRLVGVHKVRARLRDGRQVEYHYAYCGGPKFWQTGQPNGPGTSGYLDALQAVASPSKIAGADGLRSLIRAYQESNGWRRLSDRTRADYSIWLAEIDKRFGDAPKAAFDLPCIRPVVVEWRDKWSGRQADYAWQVIRRLVGWGLRPRQVAAPSSPRRRQGL
jgi:hypothetical protein